MKRDDKVTTARALSVATYKDSPRLAALDAPKLPPHFPSYYSSTSSTLSFSDAPTHGQELFTNSKAAS